MIRDKEKKIERKRKWEKARTKHLIDNIVIIEYDIIIIRIYLYIPYTSIVNNNPHVSIDMMMINVDVDGHVK